jgi:hypothetical protein
MILEVHIPGAPSYDIGEEIWQQSLDEAIADEAQRSPTTQEPTSLNPPTRNTASS